MINTLLRLWLLLWCLALSGWLCAQNRQADSLKKRLSAPGLTVEEQVMTMGRLSRALYFADPRGAIALEKKALQISRHLTDGQYKAFTFATLTYLYIQADSVIQATQAIDSALWYAGRTNNNTVKGYVWFRKGWLENYNDQPDTAARSLVQALHFLDGQQAYSYESSICYYMAGIYAYWNDPDRQETYARRCLQAALQGQDPDDICRGYQIMASYFLYRFRSDTAKRNMLDSSLAYDLRALEHTRRNRDRMIFLSTSAVSALNTANLYFEYYRNKDSAVKYIHVALPLAEATREIDVLASCYSILSEYASAAGRYQEAEQLLLTAMLAAEKDGSSSLIVKARLLKALSALAEKRGDQTKALQYYKTYTDDIQRLFDTEKLNTVQKLEAQFRNEKKEQELKTLQERAAFNRKLNFFYISLAIACLLALFFLFRSYNFRLKASLRQQQLLEKEKEDARLQSQLSLTEARKLELEKHEALLQARLKEEEAARYQAEQQLLQERQERLQKELLAGTLQVEEKNELLLELQKKITEIAQANPALKRIDRIITESQRLDEDFETLKADFAEIHTGFFSRLQQKAGNSLTRLDLKYCSYILMGLSNKEIAVRLNVESKSIRMARYRIKQKLNLDKEKSLDHFIRSLA
jgi:DNA-binding CsgD family transcriptional regulator